MSGLLKKLLLATGVAFLLAGAASTPRYPPSAKSTRTTVTVNIVWLRDLAAVNAICSFMMDIPINKPDTIVLGCYYPPTQTIYAVEPTSFNDTFHLEILGHEFWHALGAVHPEN